MEFEYAKFGMIGLETTYAVISTSLPEVTPEKWVTLLSTNPRKLFGLATANIKEGSPASLTLFEPGKKWTVTEQDLKSKSKNTAFIGRELTGKVTGIINGDKLVLA